ncbi:type III secretion system protein SctP [Trinickia soli]|uniref:Type III secretion protein HpaP n=1 Tax=Trinickia soli TaxID=380675 RepID=A0A2N7VHG1_9BURK|nr:type III secretion system protein SctP [Trinickia soli]KAA0080335.1 hypothetical protein CIW54_23390 [Paraburkholderia sp. T12-10]PMS16594.1 hypothetical protein C0Z19_25650 [Trinickia soli]CAB3676959.1 hypothetical protein LMG24076_02223 [Trinickia soli]
MSMNSVNPLPVRILPGELPGGFAPPNARRGDYGALVRLARRAPRRSPVWWPTKAGHGFDEDAGRRQAGETMRDEQRETPDAHEPPTLAREHAPAPLAARHAAPRAAVPAQAGTHARAPIGRRIEMHAAPCVGAVAAMRQEFDGWVRFLVERAADFCCDRAVGAQGQWAIRLALDPAILPECTLHLSLSHFTLALRFETQASPSRQLVLHHEETLKAQLAATLAQRGEPRDIEIAVD